MSKRGREDAQTLKTFTGFLDLPTVLQFSILDTLSFRELLSLHGKLGVPYDAPRYRNVVNLYFERQIISILGHTNISKLIPKRRIDPSYWRHFYMATIASANDDLELEGPTYRLDIKHKQTETKFEIIPGTIGYTEYPLRQWLAKLGYELSVDENNQIASTVYKSLNRIDITAILFYFIHIGGLSIHFEGFYIQEPYGRANMYIRSCISCNATAKYTCECHSKSYCDQECANIDH